MDGLPRMVECVWLLSDGKGEAAPVKGLKRRGRATLSPRLR